MDTSFHKELLNLDEFDLNKSPLKPAEATKSQTASKDLYHYTPASPTTALEHFSFCSKYVRSIERPYGDYCMWSGLVEWKMEHPRLNFSFFQIGGSRIDKLPINKTIGFKLSFKAQEGFLCDFVHRAVRSTERELSLFRYTLTGVEAEIKQFDKFLNSMGSEGKNFSQWILLDLTLLHQSVYCNQRALVT
jgi:hypothetical protein